MTHASTPKTFATHDGKKVLEVELTSKTNVRVSFLSYGALIRDWQVPSVEGKSVRHVVCGFDRFEDYVQHSPYFGAIVGRTANRIGESRFTLGGKEYTLPANEGPNHLHGGPKGFAKQVWDMEILDEKGEKAVRFTIKSPDGEMGYPGNLTCTVTYRLIDYRLRIEMEAVSDAETPVSLIQHSYFNLMGDGGEVKDHKLHVHANQTLVVREDLIPTGKIRSVHASDLDFTKSKTLKDKDGNPLSLDNSLVLNGNREEPAATLESADQVLTLKLWTDQPSLHVYTGGGLNLTVPGLNGQHYPRFGAICLEDQNFPDAVNHPNLPSIILRPPATYKHVCEIEIAPGKGA